MRQATVLPSLRVMLVCCNEKLLGVLQQYVTQTQWWQSADADISYGELQMTAVVLASQEDREGEAAAGACARHTCGMPIKRIAAKCQQHQWQLAAADMALLQQWATQQDWLVFIDDQAPASDIALLQLLVAESLHISVSATARPQFIQCQLASTPADWSVFYQQLDIHSRWQSLIGCRWLLTCPDAEPFAIQNAAAAKPQEQWLAGQLYLLLLAGLPADIGPGLDDLTSASLAPASVPSTAEKPQTAPFWLDWGVQLADEQHLNATLPVIHFDIPQSSDYTADLRLTEVSVLQGSVFDHSPELDCQQPSHHWCSQIRVCVKQLPVALPLRHLLLLQRQRPRPQWQLRGYWRLILVE